MSTLSWTSLALLVGSAAAKQCQNLSVPVTIEARTGVFGNTIVPITNVDATTFAQNQTQQGRNYSDFALTGYQTTSGTYHMSAEFCQPDGAPAKDPTLQILTHGIGFDKTYWDLSYNNFNYSYVDVATDKYKYCTFAIDRLGIGNSSHGEPLNEIQASLEIAALAELTMMLRNGTLPGISHAFSKVVHVGHSFGSAQTYGLSNAYPTISDAIVLTGFSTNGSFVGYFGAGSDFEQAYLNQPFRFGNASDADAEAVAEMLKQPISALNNATVQEILVGYELIDYVDGLVPVERVEYVPGYLTNANQGANQYLFLLPGHYDPEIAVVAEKTKQPVTVGELLTLSSGPKTSEFAGPILIVTGSNDLPYCGGDCLATGNPDLPSIPAAAVAAFPKVGADNFTAYIQPNSGHGINAHYNSTGAYDVINEYLNGKGLATT